MEEYSVYNDISKRTNGEFYLGVCGPVRTGKSTFIKKFMEMFVLPGIEDENDIKRAMDELPQSAEGDRKSTRLNSSHTDSSRMPSSA